MNGAFMYICSCGHCQPMPSSRECICCHEVHLVHQKIQESERIFHASLYMMALFLFASTYGCCKLHISNTVSSMEILLQAKQISKLVVIKKYVVTNTVSFLQAMQVCCL